jgi:hypothetical protein
MKGDKAVKGDKMEKAARAAKAQRVMERKLDVCTQLRALAWTPEQAYTLRIVGPGLLPNVSASISFSLIKVSAAFRPGQGSVGSRAACTGYGVADMLQWRCLILGQMDPGLLVVAPAAAVLVGGWLQVQIAIFLCHRVTSVTRTSTIV